MNVQVNTLLLGTNEDLLALFNENVETDNLIIKRLRVRQSLLMFFSLAPPDWSVFILLFSDLQTTFFCACMCVYTCIPVPALKERREINNRTKSNLICWTLSKKFHLNYVVYSLGNS